MKKEIQEAYDKIFKLESLILEQSRNLTIKYGIEGLNTRLPGS